MVDQKTPTWNVLDELRANARALRRGSTDAERILWSELRDHRLNGAGFRRQVPIETTSSTSSVMQPNWLSSSMVGNIFSIEPSRLTPFDRQ